MPLFQPDADSAAITFPPPVVFAGMLLTGGLIDRILGVERFWLGWPVISIIVMLLSIPAIYLLGNALRAFLKAGNNPEPWKEATVFIASGPYRYTRNPMYLGMALAYLTLALSAGSPGAIVLLPVTLWLITRFVIVPEEAYLARKFGQTYVDYKGNVRRWI
jgi:protein-S-isoprenylcysteine O-methyltransferase Ste14